MNNTSLETLNLASISGIIVVTMFLVEILKRLNFSWFGRIPVFVYAGVIAVILAFVANQIPTDNGSVMLEGNRWKLMWAALIGALASSGFYTWLSNPKELRNTRKLGGSVNKVVIPLCFAGLLLGCGCPEKAILRESMDQSTRTIRETQLEWAEKLTLDPETGKNHATEIKPLTTDQRDQFRKAHEEYNQLVTEDRARG